MTKKRMTLSLLALIGSVFLFVFTSYAWFTYVTKVQEQGPTLILEDIRTTTSLSVSSDGSDYFTALEIDFDMSVPGDRLYYRLEITNQSTSAIYSKVLLTGFTDDIAIISGTHENYLEGRSLMSIIRITAWNTVNTEEVTDQLMTDMIPYPEGGDYTNSNLTLMDNMLVEPEQTAVVYFTFAIDTLAGNDYENLKLSIANIAIQSVSS